MPVYEFNKESWEKAWSEYDSADKHVEELKNALIAAETARSVACEMISKMVPRDPKGKIPKIRRNGAELTVVVRPNPSLGRDTYFFRGKSKDEGVFEG